MEKSPQLQQFCSEVLESLEKECQRNPSITVGEALEDLLAEVKLGIGTGYGVEWYWAKMTKEACHSLGLYERKQETVKEYLQSQKQK